MMEKNDQNLQQSDEVTSIEAALVRLEKNEKVFRQAAHELALKVLHQSDKS